MSDLPAPDPSTEEEGPELAVPADDVAVEEPQTRETILGTVEGHIVDEPEVHTNFAPQAPSTIGEGWPIGVAAPGVASGDTTWLNGVEYVVGDDGCVTAPV